MMNWSEEILEWIKFRKHELAKESQAIRARVEELELLEVKVYALKRDVRLIEGQQ
jgi:hypothetical protein